VLEYNTWSLVGWPDARIVSRTTILGWKLKKFWIWLNNDVSHSANHCHRLRFWIKFPNKFIDLRVSSWEVLCWFRWSQRLRHIYVLVSQECECETHWRSVSAWVSRGRHKSNTSFLSQEGTRNAYFKISSLYVWTVNNLSLSQTVLWRSLYREYSIKWSFRVELLDIITDVILRHVSSKWTQHFFSLIESCLLQ